jgi:hypothetical protein
VKNICHSERSEESPHFAFVFAIAFFCQAPNLSNPTPVQHNRVSPEFAPLAIIKVDKEEGLGKPPGPSSL